MSLMGRALGGIGVAGGQLASKYIDEELAQRRAQFLADLQQQSMERADAYTNSPERRGRLRGEAALDTTASAAATDAAALARARNTDLTDATVAQANRVTLGTSDATAQAAGARQRALSDNTPQQLSPGQQSYMGGSKVAENTRQTSQETQEALYRDGLKQAAGSNKLPEAVKLQVESLNKQIEKTADLINKGLADGTLSAKKSEKNPDAYENLQTLRAQQVATQLQRDKLLSGAGSESGAKPDILGLRASQSGAPERAGSETVVGTAEQRQRDQQAGRLMVDSEYGGDVGKARQALARIEAEAAKASGETRTMMQSEASRLRAGIEAAEGKRGRPAAKESPVLMEQAAAAEKSTDPLAGLSRSAVREKRAELVSELKRWQGKNDPNSAARVAELSELIDRIDTGRY